MRPLSSQGPDRRSQPKLYIPLLNIPYADIALRPEFGVLFKYANIEEKHLCTLDDIPLPTSPSPSPSSSSSSPLSEDNASKAPGLRSENTEWILTDHNKLTGTLAQHYSTRVSGCIDHHEDEHAIPTTKPTKTTSPTTPKSHPPEPRIIQKAGSCASLVTLHLRSAWDSLRTSSSLTSGAAHGQSEDESSLLNDGSTTRIWDAQVAYLALGAILIDTANLTAKGKVEPVDREAISYLETQIMAASSSSSSFDRRAFYEEIETAKKNVGKLPIEDILRKDYKVWDVDMNVEVEVAGNRNGNEKPKSLKLGISSVVLNLSFLIDKADRERDREREDKSEHEDKSRERTVAFNDITSSFMTKRNLDVFAIMTAFTTTTDEDDEKGEGKGSTFQRELKLQTNERAGRGRVGERFLEMGKSGGEGLGLEDCDLGLGSSDERSPFWRKTWVQREVGKSRKQVGPMLRLAMERSC
ncbi:Exopolyphosphatase [Bachmanniomyces sp. S44760]|nr:Exopolyphosphatase [Bachmanniomyces sp. S44760]